MFTKILTKTSVVLIYIFFCYYIYLRSIYGSVFLKRVETPSNFKDN